MVKIVKNSFTWRDAVLIAGAVLLCSCCVAAQNIFFVPPSYSVGNFPVGVVWADFDQNGSPDLASANYFDNNVSVLLNNGDGTFQSARNYSAGVGPEAIVTADFNHDGKPDVAVVNYTDGTVSVLLGNGDGTFSGQIVTAAGANPGYVAAGDLNADGNIDLVVADLADPVGLTVLLGHGDGTFSPGVLYSAGSLPLTPVLGDFNQDGKIDVAVGNCDDTSASFLVLLGNGDGSLQAPITYPVTGSCPTLAVGDFNRDGKPDLIGDSTGELLLIGQGDGTFRQEDEHIGGSVAQGIGDFNHDGAPDLAIGTSVSLMRVLLNTGAK